MPLSDALLDRLTQAGLQCFADRQGQLPDGSLLIYPQPHALFSDPTHGHALLEGYRAVLERVSGNRLIADWRLLGLEPEGLSGWLNGAHPCPPARVTPPTPGDPLQALLLCAVLNKMPELLDCYLDLELQAELAQTPADSSYAQRLLAGQEADQLVAAWWSLQQRARERQEQMEQLNQVQEELEHYFLLSCRQAELIEQLEQQQRRALRLLARSSQRPSSLIQAPPGGPGDQACA
ncbi:hypothetical protein KBY96_15710 [Cyanobium sp. ATX 6A2]|uniref:hypothetical protein n=1 Tax=Cyanobium sp. ATX 6A2 TaxID=2823700 RepID=UPI0020CD2A7D|nr:hypothetical protein [Cyanobium sp. ATX 6A2]MCP9889362.1 hypothetical protein [Cyanobium sp. ATX 6A2]